jgi:release factor glutamine methyltransferase
MRHFLIRLLHPILRRLYAWWSRRSRTFHKDGLDMVVLPGVFHPGIFISTGLMAEHVASLRLEGRGFLELGAGAGRVALIAAKKGARVTASDINPASIENVKVNADRNKLQVNVVRSDLFDALPQHFDTIAINPPYYPYEPRNEAEKAFFAGGDRDYFRRLFPELARRIASDAEVYMVLSDDLDRKPIEAIAGSYALRLKPVRRKSWLGEAQVVHRILPVDLPVRGAADEAA